MDTEEKKSHKERQREEKEEKKIGTENWRGSREGKKKIIPRLKTHRISKKRKKISHNLGFDDGMKCP